MSVVIDFVVFFRGFLWKLMKIWGSLVWFIFWRNLVFFVVFFWFRVMIIVLGLNDSIFFIVMFFFVILLIIGSLFICGWVWCNVDLKLGVVLCKLVLMVIIFLVGFFLFRILVVISVCFLVKRMCLGWVLKEIVCFVILVIFRVGVWLFDVFFWVLLV